MQQFEKLKQQPKLKNENKNGNTILTRTIKQKKFVPDPPKDPRKVILAVHGLGDSLSTWEEMARQWQEQGYEVMTYDQAGHGFDELRRRNSPLDIRQMQYDFYGILQSLQDEQSIGELHVVGHSLGGALISNSQATLNQTYEKPPDAEKPNPNPVKSICLISPALMPAPVLTMGMAKVKHPQKVAKFDTSPEVSEARKVGIRRIGGPNPFKSIGTLLSNIAKAFSNIKRSVQGDFAPKHQENRQLPIHIIGSKDDAMVSSMDYLKFHTTLYEQGNVDVRLVDRVGHNPHAPGSAVAYTVADSAVEHFKQSVVANVAEKAQLSMSSRSG